MFGGFERHALFPAHSASPAVRELGASSERTDGRAAHGWRRFDHGSASRLVVLARPEHVDEFIRATARANSRSAWPWRHVGDFGQ